MGRSIGRSSRRWTGKPTPAERQILANLHKKTVEDLGAKPQRAQELLGVGETPVDKKLRPTELAAMMMVTRAILNLHERITRN